MAKRDDCGEGNSNARSSRHACNDYSNGAGGGEAFRLSFREYRNNDVVLS